MKAQKRFGRKPSERNLALPPKPAERRPTRQAGTDVKPDLSPISQRNRELIAEAAHRAVCEVSNSDGFGRCLLYAVAGWSLLHRFGYHVQAGTLMILADPDHGGTKGGHGYCHMDASNGGFERGEYHCWLSREVGNRVEAVDLASRHYQTYVEHIQPITGAITLPGGGSVYFLNPDGEKKIHWTREDPPTSIWTHDGHAEDLAIFLADEASCYSVWSLMRETNHEMVRVRNAARRHYLALTRSSQVA